MNFLKNLFKHPGRATVIAVPFLWLTFAFLIPFLIVCASALPIWIRRRQSVRHPDDGGGWRDHAEGQDRQLPVHRAGRAVCADLSELVKFAAITAALCLAIGYPFAYFMARAKPAVRPVLLMLVMMPFWTSFLLRIYAWKGILANNGILNSFLIDIGVISEPLHLMNTSSR
jgi:putrescine transport system permease protein